jgi:streptomycin 6-kinase
MRIPETVRTKALVAGAHQWLDDLPALVADLERDWEITAGDVYDGGTEAYVARAVRADGTPAVLKLLVPRPTDDAANEITVLRLADGDGCAALLRDDASRGAMLVERLGPSLADLRLPIGQRHEILCTTAQRLWRPAAGSGLPTGAQKGRWLIDHIVTTWEKLDRPCDERAVDHALACAEHRIVAHDDERAVLVHGDVHEWNTLSAVSPAVGGWKFVDPDGLLAEAEYDMGIVMREDAEELMQGEPYARARWLAQRTGLDATAIWEWGVVERVSTGLLCTMIGLQPFGRQMLSAADRIAADL